MQNSSFPAARKRGRWLPYGFSGLVLGAVVATFAACSSGDRTLDAVDPNAVVAVPTFDQVNAIIQNNCVSCHSGSGEGEGDAVALGASATAALEDMSGLETCDAIVALRFDIIDQVNANKMPPGALPRLTSEQKLTIQRWAENGALAPCNPLP